MRKIAGIPSDSDSENSSLEDEVRTVLHALKSQQPDAQFSQLAHGSCASPAQEAAVAGMDARKAQRPRINDTDALQEALEEIAWPTEASWDEAQAVTADEPTTVADVDDDLERELAFYNQVCSRRAAGRVSCAPCASVLADLAAGCCGVDVSNMLGLVGM